MVVPTKTAQRRGWLTPAAIAKATGGRVVRSGRAALGIATDTRVLAEGECFVALRGEHFDGHDFLTEAFAAGARGVVVDRPIDSLRVPSDAFVVRVDDAGAALMAIAAEHRRRHAAKVVGITGSCGKTSAKDMLAHIVGRKLDTVASPASYNNQVGVPLTLLEITPKTEVAIVEIGTNAPGEIEALTGVAFPDIGIVTCVAPAHLEGLGSIAGVAYEKAGLLRGMSGEGLLIVNNDDIRCRAMGETWAGPKVSITVGVGGGDWYATDVRFCSLGTTFVLGGSKVRRPRPVSVPRLGSHNVHNALLCIAAAHALGVELDAAIERLASLPPTGRRLEQKVVGGVTLFDDTYNMNPASARAALIALGNATPSTAAPRRASRRIVVFGGMAELGPKSPSLHRDLGDAVAKSDIDVLVTVGDTASEIAEGARQAGMDPACVVCMPDHSHARAHLGAMLRGGDLVLCKASRCEGLDRLVDALVEDFGRSGSPQQAAGG